jgi:hypothetical protein
MKLEKISAVSVFIILILTLVFMNTTFSQPEYAVTLIATGPGSSTSKDTIATFGWDTRATYCRDTTLFGETELPPPPPDGNWDYRFTDSRGFFDACMGQGTRIDIRPWTPGVASDDTFQVQVKLVGAGTWKLKWDPITNAAVTSAILVDGLGIGVQYADMKVVTTATIPNNMKSIWIITNVVGPASSVKAENVVPTSFGLQQNYPNPFNPTTNVKFAVPAKSDVEIVVFDMLGRKVRTLVSENLSANVYSVEWNGQNDNGTALASGIYNIRMTASSELGNTFTDVRKVVLMK